MRIEILSKNQTDLVCPVQWDTLARESINCNPFYERWSLLSAFQSLADSSNVHLVCVYQKEQLVSLFPIEILKHSIGLKYLSFWCHTQCFLSDPLSTQPDSIPDVLDYLLKKFKLSIAKLSLNTLDALGHLWQRKCFQFNHARGAIDSSTEIDAQWNHLSRKVRTENKRISNRISKELSPVYKTSSDSPELDWLNIFCEMEHSGWKGFKGDSILSRKAVYRYYQQICEKGLADGTVEFQGLFSNQNPLAISFRMVTRNRAFELKTSYQESYKKFYPGVVLELENMLNMSFDHVDSCTNSDNYLVNRLWPDSRAIITSIYFRPNWIGRFLRKFYQFKRLRAD